MREIDTCRINSVNLMRLSWDLAGPDAGLSAELALAIDGKPVGRTNLKGADSNEAIRTALDALKEALETCAATEVFGTATQKEARPRPRGMV